MSFKLALLKNKHSGVHVCAFYSQNNNYIFTIYIYVYTYVHG